MKRVAFQQLKDEFERVLLKTNFKAEKAQAVAEIFASNSRDGVYSHGLNRFPVFIEYVRDGLVNPDAKPVFVDRFGALERWDGQLGPGMLNAVFCMDRAIELAKENGVSCVAIKNTSHWMRGGTYGWQAAEAGLIGICFTNTIANTTPWGGVTAALGNNPLIIAIPREEGHVVLDMAMTQFSFGKLQEYKLRGQSLPFDGGYDEEGKLTSDPATIMKSQRALPMGLWKGSGLSLVLDMLAAVLSSGRTTASITADGKEYGISQVFICMKVQNPSEKERLVNEIIAYTKPATPEDPSKPVAYPGEHTLKTRLENMEKGIPVDEEMWQRLLDL